MMKDIKIFFLLKMGGGGRVPVPIRRCFKAGLTVLLYSQDLPLMEELVQKASNLLEKARPV